MENKKILFIDDEEFFIKPIQMYLESKGLTVVIAEDGISGLNLARSESPDAIILDLMLPVIDGYHVCRLLKFDNQYRHIPIVIVSAKDTDRERDLGKQSGADLYVTKPVDPENLYEQLKAYL
ncbi:MAG: response regulator transcription factor [Fidelibacterota bacterium]